MKLFKLKNKGKFCRWVVAPNSAAATRFMFDNSITKSISNITCNDMTEWAINNDSDLSILNENIICFVGKAVGDGYKGGIWAPDKLYVAKILNQKQRGLKI